MKALQLNTRPYMKLVWVLGILMAVAALTGMTESKLSYDLLAVLPPDLNTLQGHAIFQNL